MTIHTMMIGKPGRGRTARLSSWAPLPTGPGLFALQDPEAEFLRTARASFSTKPLTFRLPAASGC